MLGTSSVWWPGAAQWAGPGQAGDPGGQSASPAPERLTHGRLSETPAAACREPGPSASCPEQRLPHTALTQPGRQAGAVVGGGTDGRGSADSRQDLTHETDRERDIRLLEWGFPISAAGGVPPTRTSTAAPIPPLLQQGLQPSRLAPALERPPSPKGSLRGRGGAGGPASEPPWAVSPLCGFSWGPTGLAGLVPKLRCDSATPWGPAVGQGLPFTPAPRPPASAGTGEWVRLCTRKRRPRRP